MRRQHADRDAHGNDGADLTDTNSTECGNGHPLIVAVAACDGSTDRFVVANAELTCREHPDADGDERAPRLRR